MLIRAAVFLAPISGILAADYWLVKKQRYDIAGLYDPRGRYRFSGPVPGCNWRAFLAFIVPVAPLLPGLAQSIVSSDGDASNVHVNAGIENLYTFNWLFGFVVSIFIYTTLSWLFPDKQTLLQSTIWHLDGLEQPIDGQASDEEHGRLGFKNGGTTRERSKGGGDAKPL